MRGKGARGLENDAEVRSAPLKGWTGVETWRVGIPLIYRFNVGHMFDGGQIIALINYQEGWYIFGFPPPLPWWVRWWRKLWQ